MKIAYTSDLHIDFYMKDGKCSNLLFDKAFSKYFGDIDSNTLIIAGDIGHYPGQTMRFLDILRTKYDLDILVVLGNHEGYLIGAEDRIAFPTGLHKIAYQQELFSENGIKVLDGTSYDINGITIGGANSFYDGTIYYRMSGMYSSGINGYWKRTMNDSRYMKLDCFMEYSRQEKDKLKLLKDTCDIMVTHMKPVVDNNFFSPMYQNDMTNAFYSFDFEEEVATDTKLTHWIYGHTHVVEEFDFLGVKLLANPYGYSSESIGKQIKYLEL